MKSIWETTTSAKKRETLHGELSVDTAVIGGGMAGILIADRLSRRGIHSVVLEARQIGSGQTRCTTAKITSQHDLIYGKLIQNFGEDKALQYAQAQQAALAEYRKIIRQQQIDCEFLELPSFLYAAQDTAPLIQEAKAAAQLGIDAVFLNDISLPVPVKGAVRFAHQAQFHPLKFLYALADKLTIYENTPVLSVKGHRLFTPSGIVQAKHIVFACHYPFINFPGFYFLRMYQERSYVLALEHAAVPDGIYLGTEKSGLSLRTAGSFLLLGGGSHRCGENTAGGKYEHLRDKASLFFPGSKEAACWSAQDCMTLDGVPYIGTFARHKPYWYVATGFGKWGMTNSMVSAMLIADQICEIPNPYAPVFSPQRISLRPSAKTFLSHAGKSAKGLGQSFIVAPLKGEDVPRCPHLGCKLEWNPDEQTWDCPCHGSRFDAHGERLCEPAQTSMSKKEK